MYLCDRWRQLPSVILEQSTELIQMLLLEQMDGRRTGE